jgi:hypothetical protein
VTDDELTALATMHLAGTADGDTLDLLPMLRAVADAARSGCAALCLGMRERHRDGTDIDFHRGYNFALEEASAAIKAGRDVV